jgi:very-short-patch-repair endonuclease
MYEIDCLWRAPRVIVELDGRAAHDTARAFERDRAKDRRLTVAGWRPARVTWRQLASDEAELARDLVALTT